MVESASGVTPVHSGISHLSQIENTILFSTVLPPPPLDPDHAAWDIEKVDRPKRTYGNFVRRNASCGDGDMDKVVPPSSPVATVRVYFVHSPLNYTEKCSFLLALFRTYTFRQFVATVEAHTSIATRYDGSFYCYAPVLQVKTDQRRPWRVIRDVKDVVDMVRNECSGQGIYMCEMRDVSLSPSWIPLAQSSTLICSSKTN